MITWSFSKDADTTIEDRQLAKFAFLEHLGKFRNEFEENEAFVNIIFDKPDKTSPSFTFNFADEGKRHDFMIRFNEWIKAGRPE